MEVPKTSGADQSLGALTEKLVSNIGSSGEDGVRYGFDSFFDITYEPTFRTIETEIIAVSLTGTYSVGLNEAQIIDKAKMAASAEGGDIYYGHVTVLK